MVTQFRKVCSLHFIPSLQFIPGLSLQSAFYTVACLQLQVAIDNRIGNTLHVNLQSVFYPLVCSLRFTLTEKKFLQGQGIKSQGILF